MTDKPQKHPEGFRRDGSWGVGLNAGLTGFIRDLCHVRRTRDNSPASISTAIRAAGHERAFPHLDEWDPVAERTDLAWLFLRCETSAEETVRRGGLGTDAEFLPDGRAVHKRQVIRRELSTDELQQLRLAERWFDEPATVLGEDVPPPPERVASAEV